jgi:uncharacterized protein GlcG (DUF336 family)
MHNPATRQIVEQLIATIERLVPEFLQNPDDQRIAGGNVALCIIDSAGRIDGRLFGSRPGAQRGTGRIAWQKASQVWVTGIATGRFEELVFSRQVREEDFPLERPDYIGWLGGLPLALEGGELLAVAFSGMRGESDCEIIVRAAGEVLGLPRDQVVAMTQAIHPLPGRG